MARRLSGTRLLFLLAALGCVAGIAGAVISGRKVPAQPPVFDPAPNPYADGIYANGIVESDQANGSNTNLYTEVAGTVTAVPVRPGQAVRRGTLLLQLDDRVQRALVEQQRAQAQAAAAQLDALRAQPRPESLLVADAQLRAAEAAATTAHDTFAKLQHAHDIDAHAVSGEALDSARNGWLTADANRLTAQRQLELVRAGAWQYDLRNQEAQARAAARAAESAAALLEKFALRAPADGTVLAIHAGVGAYITPQGLYDTYTQASNLPPLVFGSPDTALAVRCYVDEILIPRLNAGAGLRAQMFVRGTRVPVPLAFVRVDPYVSPKVALADGRQERVDVRVLPVIFRFTPDARQRVYAGQLVDVYIGH